MLNIPSFFIPVSHVPTWFVPRLFTLLPGTPFGMVCLFCGSLRHRARDLENVAFSNLRSPIAIALLRRFGRAPSIQRPQRLVMPTITRPSISIPSISHLLSSSLNHCSSRILRATFTENLTFQSSRGKKEKQLCQTSS